MIFKKRYPSLSIAENYLSGHISLGPVTIFGENAMHWAVVIETRTGYLSFRLPLRWTRARLDPPRPCVRIRSVG